MTTTETACIRVPEFLTECDRVLSNCGRIQSPPGAGWVDFPTGLQYAKFLPSGSPASTEQKLIETPVTFVLKAFQAYAQPASVGAVYWRLRLPNGHFFESTVNCVDESYNNGSFRQTFEPHIECQPGDRLFITVDGLLEAGTDVAVTVLFEGALRYTLKGESAGCAAPVLQGLPALFRLGDPNLNPLAPEWRLGNQCYPETPPGYRDYAYIYLLQSQSAVSLVPDGSVIANQPLLIGSDSDFVARGLNFLTTSKGGASGTLYVRIRDHTGYELTDGFCQAGRISTVLFPELWIHSAGLGGALFYDYTFADGNSTGNFLIQPVVHGVRRLRQ
jgi:hypothetical protein